MHCVHWIISYSLSSFNGAGSDFIISVENLVTGKKEISLEEQLSSQRALYKSWKFKRNVGKLLWLFFLLCCLIG